MLHFLKTWKSRRIQYCKCATAPSIDRANYNVFGFKFPVIHPRNPCRSIDRALLFTELICCLLLLAVDIDGTPRILWARHRHVQLVQRGTRLVEALIAVPVAFRRGEQAGRYDDADAQVPQPFPAGHAQVSKKRIML